MENITAYLYQDDLLDFVEETMYSTLEKIPDFERPPYKAVDATLTAIMTRLHSIKDHLPQ